MFEQDIREALRGHRCGVPVSPSRAPESCNRALFAEALSALRADDVLVEALGKDFVEWYTLVKDAELADVAASTAKFAATGLDHDAAVQEAWNSLYFEFV